MIFDKFENMPKYYATLPQLEKFYDFLVEFKKDPQTKGGYKIDGDLVTAGVSTYVTKDHEGGRYEAHREHIDVQIVIKGKECIGWAPLSDCTMVEDFEEGGDCAFFSSDNGTMVNLYEDYFMIMFPQDAHMPCMKCGDNSEVTKIISKVKIV